MKGFFGGGARFTTEGALVRATLGVDLGLSIRSFSISRDMGQTPFSASAGFVEPSFLVNGGVLIGNEKFTKETAEAAITAGKVDAVAFGKQFIANPDLPLRFKLNAPLNPPDPASFYGGDARGYTDYPALATESASA